MPSGFPIGNINVQLPDRCATSIRRPNELLSVRTEHGKAVELGVRGDLLESGTIDVHQVEIEVSAMGIPVIRREDDALSVGRIVRREVGPAQVGDLMLV